MHKRQPSGTRGPKDSKSNTCTEQMEVYATDINVKVGAHYPGRSVIGVQKNVRYSTVIAEVSRDHMSGNDQPAKGRTEIGGGTT